MKNYILITLLSIGSISFAQNKENKHWLEPQYKSDRAVFNKNENVLRLEGNVVFQTAILTLKNADLILWNRSTNEIIAYGQKEFEIDGSIEITDKADKKILRYKLGEKIAYLE